MRNRQPRQSLEGWVRRKIAPAPPAPGRRVRRRCCCGRSGYVPIFQARQLANITGGEEVFVIEMRRVEEVARPEPVLPASAAAHSRYRCRGLESMTRDDVLRTLCATPNQVRAVARVLTPTQLAQPPRTGEWSMTETLRGSALGARHFRGLLCVHSRYGPMTRSPSKDGFVDGLQDFGFPTSCRPATGFLTPTPVGLSPTRRASLFWTHNRTCGFPASGSRTGFTPEHAQVAQDESAEAGTRPALRRPRPRRSASSLAKGPCAAAAESAVPVPRRSDPPPDRP